MLPSAGALVADDRVERDARIHENDYRIAVAEAETDRDGTVSFSVRVMTDVREYLLHHCIHLENRGFLASGCGHTSANCIHQSLQQADIGSKEDFEPPSSIWLQRESFRYSSRDNHEPNFSVRFARSMHIGTTSVALILPTKPLEQPVSLNSSA